MVNINSASLNELDSLPGIGPVMAGKILSHREENGAFRSPEELLEVPGMRRAVYEKITEQDYAEMISSFCAGSADRSTALENGTGHFHDIIAK